MDIEYDPVTKMAYITLNNNGQWHHAAWPQDCVVIDYDTDGNVQGIELIDVDEPIVRILREEEPKQQ